MKLRLLSDLHVTGLGDATELFSSYERCKFPVILAGDIVTDAISNLHLLTQILSFLSDHHSHVIYVFGNHECWYNGLDAANTVRSSIQHLKNVYLLENSSITIDGIEFFGCTLWPDYKQADPYVIRYAQTIDKNLLYIGVDFQAIQEKQRESVETLRTLPYNKNRVIITHYPPTCLSITDEFNADDIEIQYLCYSEITDGVFALSPLAWMHGHIHNSVNYKIGDTDVLANPRGDHFVRNARFDIKQSYTLDC